MDELNAEKGEMQELIGKMKRKISELEIKMMLNQKTPLNEASELEKKLQEFRDLRV